MSGIRLGSDGSFIDQGRGLFSGRAGSYAIVADTVPDAAMRTFGIFTMMGNSQWVRLRSETGSLITPANYVPTTTGPFVASDGSSFLQVYGDDSPAQLFYGTSLDPVSGLALTGSPVALTDLVSTTLQGVWFDGNSLLVATTNGDGVTADPYARFAVKRYTTAFAALDASVAEGYAVIPDKFPPAPLVFWTANDGHGKTLAVYPFPDYGGATLKGNFIYDAVTP